MEFDNTGLVGVGWESGFSFIKHVINCYFKRFGVASAACDSAICNQSD